MQAELGFDRVELRTQAALDWPKILLEGMEQTLAIGCNMRSHNYPHSRAFNQKRIEDYIDTGGC